MLELIFIILIIISLSIPNIRHLLFKSIKQEEDFILGDNVNIKKIGVIQDQSVILKSPLFDTSKIKEYKGEGIKKFEFRPLTFGQFIGQEEAKDRAKTIINKVKRGMKGHFIVSGMQGHGKTSYIEIVSRTLNAKLIKRIGKQVNEDELLNIINEINTSTETNIVFFLDEIDTMPWRILKSLNPIIESFEVSGKHIKPFLFACATINKHKLLTTNPDTLDRMESIVFNRYNEQEIRKIISQYQQELYPAENMSEEAMKIIAQNCKFNPRIAIHLLEDYIVERDIDKVLKNSKIVIAGLTQTDIAILRALLGAKRPLGANSLAQRVKLSEKEYTTEIEPFLAEYDYIARVPSRVITDKGKKILEAI